MAVADRSRWDARYGEMGEVAREPERFLLGLDDVLPRAGRALDLAGGAGRDAAWLAGRGLDVTVADASPIALDLATRGAAGRGLPIRTLSIDIEEAPFPPGPWDLILCVRFLHRPSYRSIAAHLAEGGLAVVVHPTRVNLERHPRPGPRHLLEPGELPGLLSGLVVAHSSEGWTDEGRHEARFVGRRPATTGGG